MLNWTLIADPGSDLLILVKGLICSEITQKVFADLFKGFVDRYKSEASKKEGARSERTDCGSRDAEDSTRFKTNLT